MSDKPCVPPLCPDPEPVELTVTTGYVFGPDDAEAEADWWGDVWTRGEVPDLPKPRALSLGERLAASRKMAGITQAELSRRSGVSAAYICELEGGHGRRVGAAVLQRLAGALGVEPSELLP